MNVGARIVEIPIPTFYGDEISRVNGVKYAAEIVAATIGNAAHRAGVLQQRRLDPLVVSPELKLDYASSHSFAADTIPAGARVLDIGAADSRFVQELRRRGCDAEARLRGELDLDGALTFDTSGYDYLVLLDVMSKLRRPEEFLDRLRAQFDYRPVRLVVTSANVAFVTQRGMLALGQFNYGRAGLLDRDHVRLFTLRALRHLLRDAGFRVTAVRGIPAPFPRAFGDNAFSRTLLGVNQLFIRLSKTLFAYQFLIEAEGSPDIRFRLTDTLASEQS